MLLFVLMIGMPAEIFGKGNSAARAKNRVGYCLCQKSPPFRFLSKTKRRPIMTKQLGFIGFDQYGNHYHIDKHPRKELLEKLGATRASKMYCDTKDGRTAHIGYVIKDCWISVYRVHAFHNRS
jgi:hypothetical protein